MVKFDFTGKTVIVTGGGGAIGSTTALGFAKAGANVVISDVDEKNGAAALEKLRQITENSEFVRCDISSSDDDEALVKRAAGRFGGLDILVNNAGINGQMPERKPFHEYSREFWDKLMSIDLNGTFYLSQIASRLMIEQGRGGNIVNIASVMGINPARLQCAFTVAKSGVIMLSRVMALELAKYKINVNCLCPGSILTEKTERKFYSIKEKADSLLSHIPAGRPGSTEDIAFGIMMLATGEASYMTGSNLVIDGGWQCGFTRDW